MDTLVILVLVMLVMVVTIAVMVDHLDQDTQNMVHHIQQEFHHMVEVVIVMEVIIKLFKEN